MPAGEGDDITATNHAAALGEGPRQEGVGRPEPAMIDRHRAIPCNNPGEGDDSVIGGPNDRPLGNRIVNAPMTGVAPDWCESFDDRAAHRWLDTDTWGREHEARQEKQRHQRSILPLRCRLAIVSRSGGPGKTPAQADQPAGTSALSIATTAARRSDAE